MDLFEIRGSHTRRKCSHVKQATTNNVNTSILCPAREMFSAWSQLQPWSVPRLPGSSSPAILRLEAVVSNLTHIQRINGNMFLRDMLWEGHDAVHVTRVDAYGLDVPRRRDGSVNPRQGQVFVWQGEDEMCSMMQTRVKARGSDPKCSSAQRGRVIVILTFAGTCQKIDCRQDGYKEDVQTGVAT